MKNPKTLEQEIRKIISYIDETSEEQQAREPNAQGIRTLLVNALKNTK